jgi:hypothetical protein
MAGPALFQGKVGSTGVSSGPHAHFQLTKDGKLIPLSIARKDIGQYLQFRLPNEETWRSVYNPEAQGFSLNPATKIMSGLGSRSAPVPGASTNHQGEDYSFPEGTSLRFLGQGSVSTHAGMGNAGNVSVLRTGPYELQTFHLSELPVAATTRRSTPSLPSVLEQEQQKQDARTSDILEAFMYGTQYGGKDKEEKPTLTDQLVSGVLSQALSPQRSFINQYINQEPYLLGQAASTSDYLQGLFG